MWEIKGKDNQTKATVYALEYNGEWMGESYVTVTIESPTPIDFVIGDYLMYRGERFEINYDPGKIKSAPQFTKGDAFKYENIKFNSLADELTRCGFLDVVLDDNQLHFTGLPKFSFYGSVKDLANRIQANLNRAYPDQWIVVVSPEYSSTKELNVSVDTQKVWDALSILVNDFETYFTIKGRTITIGAAGVPAGHLFKYGKGNGLYEIEQNAEADQAIITRLRAYGSTRNLPHRYYNSLTDADGQKLIPDNMAVQYLMLPSFPYNTQDPYIDSANKAALGIREGTIFFDGSQEGLEEIYPSIEGMTAEDLHKAGVPCNSTGALDELVGAEQMTDDGVGDINEGEIETTATPPTFKVTLPDLGFDINDHRTTEAATLSFKTGMLGGRDFEIVGCKKIETGGKVTGYELELNRVYDDGIKLWFPYKDYNAKAGDKVVILHIVMPAVYIKAAAQRLLEAATTWLAKNDYSRSVYAPKVDEIFMARQHDIAMASGGKIKSLHDTIKEGMLLLFEDEDLNIDASIFIDRLTIKEEGAVPTYEVVLKEEKTVGRLDKMQNQIDSLAAGKGQGGGGYTAAQIRSMIDAYGGTRFLSKIKDDRTPYALSVGGKITAESGVQFGPVFAEGITGFGGKVDDLGRAWLHSLVLRSFLEVPEIRFNRTEVSVGNDWNAPGGGVLESVIPDRDSEGEILPTGEATLHLESGEIGAVAEGDICMGIFHDSFNKESNSTEDSDDSRGNFRFAGFRTVYFTVTEILDPGSNSRFRYALRETDANYPSAYHPSSQMTFVSYGSFTREDRRTSRYSTRTYERYLRGVDDWEFGADNIAAQFGDMSNLSLFGLDLKGYSIYLDNVYMKGTIQSVGLSQYWVETSSQQVIRHSDGSLSPDRITAKGWRRSSTGVVEEADDCRLVYSYLRKSLIAGQPDILETRDLPEEGFATSGTSLIDRIYYPVIVRMLRTSDEKEMSPPVVIQQVSDGPAGEDAERFWLVSDAGSFHEDAVGAVTPGSISIRVMRQKGAGEVSDITSTLASDTCPVQVWGDDGSLSADSLSSIRPKSIKDYPYRVYLSPKGSFTILDTVSIGYTRDGNTGAQGLDGPVLRITEWEAGKRYYDGRTSTDGDPTGPRFLDIVTLTSADGMSRSIWQCTRTHNSLASLRPESTGSTSYWQRFSSLTPVYTPLLLADNAKITFLNSQEIIITENGNVVGRFGGGLIPLWIGGDTSSRAKFTVESTGRVRFGQDNGQRVELDPATNGMSIFDPEGRKTEFRGERVADIADMFRAASATVSILKADSPRIYLDLDGANGGREYLSETAATVRALTAGNLHVSCTLLAGSTHVTARAYISIAVYDSDDTVLWSQSLSVSGEVVQSRSLSVSGDIHLPAAGVYRVVMYRQTNKYIYHEPGSDLSRPGYDYLSSAGWSGLSVTASGAVYKAQYLSNGWAIGNASDSFVSAWEDASGKMCFEAVSGGKGVSVSPEGVRVNHGNGWGAVPRTVLQGWINWTGTEYQWAWRNTGDGIVFGNPRKTGVGNVFIPVVSGLPDPSRLCVQLTGRYTTLETAVGDMTVSGTNPGITALLSHGGTMMDSGFLITINEI